jgi:hypothetical protein
MVRSILAGTKTQTRRVIRSAHAQEADAWQYCGSGRWESGIAGDHGRYGHGEWVRCPFGASGDRLWVRETWGFSSRVSTDGHDRWMREQDRTYLVYGATSGDEQAARWRPSIHMPRWASRITLEVTGVRVERLQEITEEDAKAEGMSAHTYTGIHPEQRVPGLGFDGARLGDQPHRLPFADLWDTINSNSAPWASNPWVWVVSFLRVRT